jgi:hypothetical protein
MEQRVPPAFRRTGRTLDINVQMIYDSDIIYLREDQLMRTLIDLGDTQIEALDALSKKEKRSRAALIRQAIDEYLRQHRDERESEAFGLWGKRKIDGLAYQKKVRDEW